MSLNDLLHLENNNVAMSSGFVVRSNQKVDTYSFEQSLPHQKVLNIGVHYESTSFILKAYPYLT